jgi:D-alanyl-D-alanine endopeptidase (penicillin-binding protein 7)
MRSGERRLHLLEKIVALGALAGVLFVSIGFARAGDWPKLRSAVALVQDAGSGETLYEKNSETILPIASITKLMTAIVVLKRGLDLEERVAVNAEDVRATRGSHGGRLRPGSVLTRDELLLVALMASDNRAAAALGRTYPGGTEAFVAAMNAEAGRLQLYDTRFADPTGLSPDNVSSAQDLARLVRVAHGYPLIRDYSTRPSARLETPRGWMRFRNTNSLVRSDAWDIELSKTGYLDVAGRCLVMHLRVASRDLVVILLDSWGKYTRTADARRIRKWLESSAARDPQG